MSDLTLGCHLVTPRIGYTHHGIYISNEQVIHFTSNSKVEIVSLNDFAGGNGYSIQKFHSKFSRKEIVDRALSRLGDDNYNVIFNNCQHFCNWCIHDEHRSQQVQQAVGLGVITPSVAMSAISANAPTLAGLTMAEITAATGGTMVSNVAGITLLSTTPIVPAAIVGFGVFKLVQFLSD